MNWMRLASAGLALLMAAGSVTVVGQEQGSGGTGGGGTGGAGTGTGTGGTGATGGTGGATIPGNRTPTTPFPQPGQGDRQQMPQFEMQRPIYFSGKVVLEDGTPPPDQAVVELVCNGNPRPQGYTDLKGRFNITLGQNQGMFSDASYSNPDSPGMGSPGMNSTGGRSAGNTRGYSERDLMGCELRVTLAGFRSEPIQLSGRRALDNPDLGTILMKRLNNVEGYTFSMTSGLAPKDAKKAYEKGLDLSKKKKAPEAQEQFKKAVELYPQYAVAWYELGRIHEQQQQNDEAQKAYAAAIKADNRFVSPYMQIAGIEARERKWEELVGTTDRIIKLNPYNFPIAYFYNSVANFNQQNIDAAEKSAREFLKLDPTHKLPKASHLMGMILAQKKDYSGAVEYMKGYLMAAPTAPDADVVKKQISEMERFLGTAPVAQTPTVPNPPQQ